VAEPKTRPTDADVGAFLESVPDERRREDAKTVCRLIQEVTGQEPVLWGTNIVGFGSVRLRYASGRELDWPVTGFSPRKAATTVYLMDGFEERHDLLARLGPHSTGRSCLYLKRLSDVDLDVLRELVADSVRHVTAEPD
jgi:Domain of unknown function (DU1801)